MSTSLSELAENSRKSEQADLRTIKQWYIALCEKIATEPASFPEIHQTIQQAAKQSSKIDVCVLEFDDRQTNSFNLLLLPPGISVERLYDVTQPRTEFLYGYRVGPPMETKYSVFGDSSTLKYGYFTFETHLRTLYRLNQSKQVETKKVKTCSIRFVYDGNSWTTKLGNWLTKSNNSLKKQIQTSDNKKP